MGLECRVQVVDVGGVVLVVVSPHRLLVDGRLEGLVVVRQGGKGECHDRLLRDRATEFRITYLANSGEI